MNPNYIYFINISFYYIYYLGAIASSGYYIDHTWSFHIIDLHCTGKEDSIWNCSYNKLMNYNCPSSHDASLQCQGNHIYHYS